jgi:hypothetical protein
MADFKQVSDPTGATDTFTYNGNKYTLVQWNTYWSTNTTDPFIRTDLANALYNSGYFDLNTPFDTVGPTLWNRIGEWAITKAKANNGKFTLKAGNLPDAVKFAATSSTKLGDFGGYLKSGKGGGQDTTNDKLNRKDVIIALKRFASDNGFVISVADLNKKADAITGVDANGKIVHGKTASDGVTWVVSPIDTLENVKQSYRTNVIAPKYSQFADDVKAGADIKDLAHDYIAMISDSLEIDPEKIDLAKDPLLSKALLGYAGKDGKKTYPNYTDFQQMVRQDSRWQYTNNAKDTISDTAQSIKQIFGL